MLNSVKFFLYSSKGVLLYTFKFKIAGVIVAGLGYCFAGGCVIVSEILAACPEVIMSVTPSVDSGGRVPHSPIFSVHHPIFNPLGLKFKVMTGSIVIVSTMSIYNILLGIISIIKNVFVECLPKMYNVGSDKDGPSKATTLNFLD